MSASPGVILLPSISSSILTAPTAKPARSYSFGWYMPGISAVCTQGRHTVQGRGTLRYAGKLNRWLVHRNWTLPGTSRAFQSSAHRGEDGSGTRTVQGRPRNCN